jgi:hypothetical protein
MTTASGKQPRFLPRNLSFGEIMRAMSAQLSLGEFYPPMHEQFCHYESDTTNGLINRRARSQVTYHSAAISQVLARTLALLIHSARGSKNTPGSYRVARATEVASESSRRTIGVFTGNSTFEPFAMNASHSLFAAPKYPNPIAVLADACAAPAPSKPKPFRPSPDLDHAVFCVEVMSATPLDGPISEAGARSRAKVEVVALISPSLPTFRPSDRSA